MNKETLTLGSLFDGSGGFTYGALLAGITPVWASEIEPFPVRVTTKRMPFIKHYGDICSLDGACLPAVDIITFGSPCQDMSVAGKQAGIKGEKSKLFFEAIRIIREMRKITNDKKPRYIVWENVTGAFSSNKGEDFRCVIEEIIKTKNREITIPKPDKSKWLSAGEVLGNDYSLAWRTLDAQYWGVPQRRKRIYLVADFRGSGAGKILFGSERVSEYNKTSFKPWHNPTAHSLKSPRDPNMESTSPVISLQGSMIGRKSENGPNGDGISEDVSFTLTGSDRHAVVYAISREHFNASQKFIGGSSINDTGVSPTLIAKGPNAVAYNHNNKYYARYTTPTECAKLQGFPDWWCDELETENPTEDEIKFWEYIFESRRKAMKNSIGSKTRNQIIKWLKNPRNDSAEYKMWGNGVALPNVVFVLCGIKYFNETEKTSLLQLL